MDLRALQIKAGAVFNEIDGHEVPIHYGDSALEYQAVKMGVGIVDYSGRGKLRLTGKDRTRFLHGMITNTVEGLAEGAGNHAAITTVLGQTLLDLWVHNLGEYLWLETEQGFQTKLCEALNRYLIADDVVIADETDDWVILGIVGAAATETVNMVLGLVVAALPEHHTITGVWSNTPIWVTRRSFLGVDGFGVRVSASEGSQLWQALIDAGSTPVGRQAQEVVRVEAGIPRCGVEIDESVAPLEAGMPDTVDFNKGCYIGQEVIAKMHFRGKPRRYLVGLAVEGEQVLASGTEVFVEDKAVGRMTSCVYSPALNGVIALAIMRRGRHEVGQPVRMGEVRGQIVALPFMPVGA